MKVTSTDEVFELMNAYVPAAAVGAAVELELFWRLEDRPLGAGAVADALGIPIRRCRYWLDVLTELGLLKQSEEGYGPSVTAKEAILEAAGQDTWAVAAEEARERVPAIRDLALRITEDGSVWEVQGIAPPDFVGRLKGDARFARRFTRMLYDWHQELAEDLAQTLDLSEVERVMDLGGGSGVISLALLRRNPQLSSVVVDLPNVCAEGEVIARENDMHERLTFQAADFLSDDLPSGFGMVLECDVGVYEETLFRKVGAALSRGGRFVIADRLAPTANAAPPSKLYWAFISSLRDPEFAVPTVGDLQGMLSAVGLEPIGEHRLSSGETVIEARR
ncbi:MAG: methyltransferase [Anaerolineae bacterium]